MLRRLARAQDRLQRSAFAFPLAVLVAGLMLVISEGAYHGAESQLSTLVELGKARLEVITVVRRVVEAESAKRGYLLSNGRKEYLIPYTRARRDALASLGVLERTFSSTAQPDAEARRKVLSELVLAKLSELQEVIRLYDEGREEAARELILTNIGRDQMESIRNEADALLAAQNRYIGTGLKNIYDTLSLNRIGVSAMTAISLLILWMFLRQGRAIDRHRQQQADELKAERDRLEIEVKRRTRELFELARHLQTAREDERARLARDLHDELGAMLTAAKLDVARIRPSLQKVAPDLLPRLSHLTESLNTGIALKRRIIEDLRPSTLDNLGLCPALQIHCEEFAERSGVDVVTALTPVPLAPSVELTLFRMVQEGLNNIAKYARAQRVEVTLAAAGDTVSLQVRDDGIGFDPADLPQATHGLRGMRFRIESEGGRFEVDSAPGKGARLTATLPLPELSVASEPSPPQTTPRAL